MILSVFSPRFSRDLTRLTNILDRHATRYGKPSSFLLPSTARNNTDAFYALWSLKNNYRVASYKTQLQRVRASTHVLFINDIEGGNTINKRLLHAAVDKGLSVSVVNL